MESRKKTKKVVEKKVEQGDFNNFDLFDFYVSSFETPGMSFNVQIHPDIDGEETEEKRNPQDKGGMDLIGGVFPLVLQVQQFPQEQSMLIIWLELPLKLEEILFHGAN